MNICLLCIINIVCIVCILYILYKKPVELYSTNLPYVIAFTGCTKNNELTIGPVLNYINQMSLLSSKPSYLILYENDSTDNTLQSINDFTFLNGTKYILSEQKIDKTYGFTKRTQRIAHARNKILEKLHTLPNIDFVVNLDMDTVNHEHNIQEFISCFFYDHKWDVITANQSIYYDYWALRTKDFDYNIWEPGNYKPFKNELKRYFPYQNSDTSLGENKGEKYHEVLSAFGGFGIYRYNIIGNCLYDSNNGIDCEHVLFHKCIREKKGRILINPKLLNQSN